MSQNLHTSLFQEALEAVEALSLDDQGELLRVLRKRLNLRQHQQIVEEVREAQQEYREGKFSSGTVDDFLAELDS
ncbi:MAG: hypothetical protein HC916_17320 [Coleofasciculaceae cyanobacterium SM2_1_6]|nr:hypothetical protein [Coleofasciculaceae cyanobacterium SM2_1_6]